MMTAANWPNPERPGVPMFPERDGWHWVATQGNALRPLYWCWKSESWCASADPWANFWKYTEGWSYIGPCLTPTQIAELLAGERERCAKACERLKPSMDEIIGNSFFGVRGVALVDAAAAIRNLGAAP